MAKKFKSHKKQFSSSSNTSKPQHSLELLSEQKQSEIISLIEKMYQTTFRHLPKGLYINSKKRIYFSTLDFEVHKNMKRVNSLGLYLGTLVNSGHIRLSIEGSQLLYKAKNNFVVIKDEYLSSYLSGESIFFDEIKEEIIEDEKAPFLIIYDSSDNALGTVSKKEKEYLNYISKGRKMNFNRVF